MSCTIGKYCSKHNFVHGKEAEELREKLESLVKEDVVTPRLVRKLLDNVDARDSLAFLESKEEDQMDRHKKARQICEEIFGEAFYDCHAELGHLFESREAVEKEILEALERELAYRRARTIEF